MIKTRRRTLIGKIEAVEGVAENLQAADGGIIASDTNWVPDIKMLQRNAATASLSKLPDIPGLALGQISFRAEMMGRTTAFAAGNKPYVSPFLRACGFAETVVVTAGQEKVTYAPASTGVPSLTLSLFTDGVIKQLVGARGNVKFMGVVGEQLWAEFTFMGAFVEPTDGAIVTPTFPTHIPPRCLNASLAVGAFTPVVRGFSIDMQNKLAPREDVNSPTGYKSFMLTDRDPRGNFDPEMELVATHPWYGRWRAGTTAALSLGPIGTDQYNRVKLTAPKLLYTKVAQADREGNEIANTDFQLAMASGDDELVIEFS